MSDICDLAESGSDFDDDDDPDKIEVPGGGRDLFTVAAAHTTGEESTDLQSINVNPTNNIILAESPVASSGFLGKNMGKEFIPLNTLQSNLKIYNNTVTTTATAKVDLVSPAHLNRGVLSNTNNKKIETLVNQNLPNFQPQASNFIIGNPLPQTSIPNNGLTLKSFNTNFQVKSSVPILKDNVSLSGTHSVPRMNTNSLQSIAYSEVKQPTQSIMESSFQKSPQTARELFQGFTADDDISGEFAFPVKAFPEIPQNIGNKQTPVMENTLQNLLKTRGVQNTRTPIQIAPRGQVQIQARPRLPGIPQAVNVNGQKVVVLRLPGNIRNNSPGQISQSKILQTNMLQNSPSVLRVNQVPTTTTSNIVNNSSQITPTTKTVQVVTQNGVRMTLPLVSLLNNNSKNVEHLVQTKNAKNNLQMQVPITSIGKTRNGYINATPKSNQSAVTLVNNMALPPQIDPAIGRSIVNLPGSNSTQVLQNIPLTISNDASKNGPGNLINFQVNSPLQYKNSMKNLVNSQLLPVMQKIQSPHPEVLPEHSGATGSSNFPLHKSSSNSVGVHEDLEVDDEDMGVAETYAEYMPTKLKLGRKHPDPVVETASLSSVEPADVWYRLHLPDESVSSGALSALQLEAITYASQQHEHLLPDGSRAGFLIGDGAGVGKGRTIGGIIYENYLQDRKRAVWISVSNDLKYDAERDLRDIGATEVQVYSLNKFKYAKLSSEINGRVKKGVVFSTYSALIGESSQSDCKYRTRLKQLLQWCGKDFDGVIVFDECHRAKNLCPLGSSKSTKTGLTVLELQKKLPKARVVYASATGASEPRNMAYMTRLGIWGEGTPFPEFTDFITAVEKRGVGAMETVAMDMKLRGMYIARQLSFRGVTFKVKEVPLSKDFIKIYDNSVKLWVDAMKKFQEAADIMTAESGMRKTMWSQFWSAHQRFFKYMCIASKVEEVVKISQQAVKCGQCVVIGLQSTGEARTLEQLDREDGELTDFVSTAKGVFRTLVEKHFPAPDRSRIQRLLGLGFGNSDTSAEKRKPDQLAGKPSKKLKKNSDSHMSDDESHIFSACESDISDTSSESNEDSNPFVFGSDSDSEPWIHSKKKKKGKKGKKNDSSKKIVLKTSKPFKPKPKEEIVNYPQDPVDRARAMKDDLLRKIELLGEKLPPNTLDQLIDELGGPDNVAEMTGRKGRVVQTDSGIQYETRSEVDVPLETLNLTEKQRFMNGEKDIAIISDAASTGISLQSDRRAANQRRRVHITLELPWSADRAIQQFGRTHRSNQVNAPEYIFLISDLAGERRFASTVAKRLESLGALTHGDRRATETRDLSQFNIDNKYGRAALEKVMRTIMGYERPLVPPPEDYQGNFFNDCMNALIGVGLVCSNDSTNSSFTLDKEYYNISKFLNRILGLPVDLQNRLFKYFTDTLNAIISQAKKDGRFDMGILDLGTTGERVKRVKLHTFLRQHPTGKATTEIHIVHVERGMCWVEALDRWGELASSEEGFYLSHQIRNNKRTAILAVAVGNSRLGESKTNQLFDIYRPNTGLQIRQENWTELRRKYKKVSRDEAEPHWVAQYEASTTACSHAYWSGHCRSVSLGLECEVGLRQRTYNILAGSVLSVWSRVENVLAARLGLNTKMQVVRLRTQEGLKIVGTLIPKNCVGALRDALSADALKVEEKTF